MAKIQMSRYLFAVPVRLDPIDDGSYIRVLDHGVEFYLKFVVS
jgi:hypothetical protein